MTQRKPHFVLFVLCLVAMINFVDRQLLAILLMPIKADLGVSDAAMGLLTGTAFAVCYIVAGFPIARWGDRGNRRSILAGAVAVWSVMTAFCGLAQNYIQLALARMSVAAHYAKVFLHIKVGGAC